MTFQRSETVGWASALGRKQSNFSLIAEKLLECDLLDPVPLLSIFTVG